MKKKILIVDDEADLQELLSYHLEDQQVEVHIAGNCAEALVKAREVVPDLILLDILLPDVDGLTLCQAIKQVPGFSHIPIAMMSAHTSDPTRRLASAAGAVEFFPKPFNLADFKARVKWLLAESESAAAA